MKQLDTEKYYYDITHRSAVLIPHLTAAEGESILFEVRSSDIPDEPGDICFPGGSLEQGERPEQAAVRETAEELLIRPGQIQVNARLDPYRTGNLEIVPFAGRLTGYQGTFSKAECQETFTVSLKKLLECSPEKYPLSWRPEHSDVFPYERIRGGEQYRWRAREEYHFFYIIDHRVIWGITARILHAYLEYLKTAGEN